MKNNVRNEYIDRLKSLSFLKTGLWKVKRILCKLWNPQNELRVIHIWWTNGKWSVVSMISQVLHKQCWYAVGVFTSPHLVYLHERVKINDVFICDEELDFFLWKVFAAQESLRVEASYYEAVFIAAVLFFVDRWVDYAVIEVWLGWKLDATNVFKQPLCTVITHIWFDHTHILWTRFSQILWAKIWILKSWTPCFTRQNSPLMRYGASVKKSPLVVCNKVCETNLLWTHQQENAWIAYEVLRSLGVSRSNVQQWLQNIVHRWRCQWIRNNVLLDWAHNQDWVVALSKYVDNVTVNFAHLVCVFWTVKKKEAYIKYIQPHLIYGDRNYLFQVDSERAERIENLPVPFDMKLLDSFDDLLLEAKTYLDTLYVFYWSLYFIWDILRKFE